MRPCARLPGLEDMVAADAAAGGVPVRFSTVECGDVHFYGLFGTALRTIV